MARTKTKRPMSEHARTAKAIRQKLAASFPHTRFSVRSESFAGGNSVHITWTDGPTQQQVEHIVKWHEYGRFDGMTDSSWSVIHPNIPQTKYVQTRREYSREAFLACLAWVNARFGWSLRPDPQYNSVEHASDRHNGVEWDSFRIYRYMQHTPLMCPSCTHPREWNDAYCAECGAAQTEPTEYHGH